MIFSGSNSAAPSHGWALWRKILRYVGSSFFPPKISVKSQLNCICNKMIVKYRLMVQGRYQIKSIKKKSTTFLKGTKNIISQINSLKSSQVSCWVGQNKNRMCSCESPWNGDANICFQIHVLPEKINKMFCQNNFWFINVLSTAHHICCTCKMPGEIQESQKIVVLFPYFGLFFLQNFLECLFTVFEFYLFWYSVLMFLATKYLVLGS